MEEPEKMLPVIDVRMKFGMEPAGYTDRRYRINRGRTGRRINERRKAI